ncbi:MAG: sugar nucleotide-binding protein [Candidatus Omnitrophica bacterium]|nr:sugar nucleotide-binding protein [Candidatus Omnitrophota bacterium]
MRNKIFIFGRGFIGKRLQGEFKCDISGKKIYSYSDAESQIKRFNPKVIINSIGYIGRNVDDCELDKNKAMMSNAFMPIALAEVALRHKIKLVHISSGCIFHFDYLKDKPINEEKIPDFLDLFYSRTKIYAERALEVLAKKYPVLIVRPRVPLDGRPHPRNLLTKLINYKKVIDLPNSVTYMPDFIKALKHLISIDARGIYNVVNKGGLNFRDLMETYKKYNPNFKYEVISFRKLGSTRTNLILSTDKLEASGFKVRSAREILEECVRSYVKY